MAFSTYFDLLRSRNYFDRLLKYYNSKYGKPIPSAAQGAPIYGKQATVTVGVPRGLTAGQYKKMIDHRVARQVRYKSGEDKEPHYRSLIKRCYVIGKGTSTSSSITGGHVAALISNKTHIEDAYKSLDKEFYRDRRRAKLAPYSDFWTSIQTHKQRLVAVSQYGMDAINPGAVPGEVFEQLRALFHGLEVVPSSQKTKLVAVSKTLHFLLPDLVMPIDSKVLRFLGKGDNISPQPEKQFESFKDVFNRYLELTAALGLKQSNGDGNWWNWSVPKRIDNTIMGFGDLFFNDENVERIICGHMDMLLDYLGA